MGRSKILTSAMIADATVKQIIGALQRLAPNANLQLIPELANQLRNAAPEVYNQLARQGRIAGVAMADAAAQTWAQTAKKGLVKAAIPVGFAVAANTVKRLYEKGLDFDDIWLLIDSVYKRVYPYEKNPNAKEGEYPYLPPKKPTPQQEEYYVKKIWDENDPRYIEVKEMYDLQNAYNVEKHNYEQKHKPQVKEQFEDVKFTQEEPKVEENVEEKVEEIKVEEPKEGSANNLKGYGKCGKGGKPKRKYVRKDTKTNTGVREVQKKKSNINDEVDKHYAKSNELGFYKNGKK